MTKPKWTPGPWTVFIDDTGGEHTGWPLSIEAAPELDRYVVRQGGFWPYSFDAAISQREAVANAHLIAAAPLLYEAAEAAELLLHDLRMCTTKEEAWKMLRSDQDPVSVAHEDICAALAAARGEEGSK